MTEQVMAHKQREDSWHWTACICCGRALHDLVPKIVVEAERRTWGSAKAMLNALADEHKRKYYVDVTGATKAIAVSVIGMCVRSIDAKLSSLTNK